MNTETPDSLDTRRPIELPIGRIEVGLGVLMFIYGTLSPMLGRMIPGLEPDELFGLFPLLIMLLGIVLVGAGAGILNNWRWRYLMHIPLLACIVVVGLIIT